MILRRVIEHVKAQNWTAVTLDFLIVVLGVFIGIQVSNWNEARAAERRKDEVVDALITAIEDSMFVQQTLIVDTIDAGLSQWQALREQGEHPVPFYFRLNGSDKQPDTWKMLHQMQIAGLFDPVTLFDLDFYYAEADGVGEKYVRYVTFVEDRILPYENGNPLYFYAGAGDTLRPEFAANMERLREFRNESVRLHRWGACLVERLRERARPEQSCLRADTSIVSYPAERRPAPVEPETE